MVFLPSFINEVNHEGAEDEENEQGNKHVVDSPDVVHLKQLTGGNSSSRRLDSLMSKHKHSDTESSERNTAIVVSSDPPVDLLQEGPATDKLLALAVRRSKMPAGKQ